MKKWWAHTGRSDHYPSVWGSKGQWRGGLWIRIGAVLGVGLIVGAASMVIVATIYRDALRTRINTAAQALSSGHIIPLKDGETTKTTDDDYKLVEGKLARIKEANSDARFVYLMASDDSGGVYFLADSEPDNSKANSPRGEKYPEASQALKDMFNNGRTLVEGPMHDSYGNWLSVLAPVIDDETYRITAVVGMDVPAASYGLVLGVAAGGPLLLAIFAAILVYVRYQTWRKHQENVQFRAEMLSIASHELRTPLTGLRWSQESLIRQKVGNEGQQRMLQIMYDSTRRLQESIEDILQLASMESGKAQRLYLSDIDMRATLEDIVTTQQLAASRSNVAIAFTDDWPEHVVLHLDGQRMKRVFHNVLSNAVKYSNKDTTITLGFSRSKTEEYVISVHDDGIGVPKEEQAAVWGGFYRATNTRDRDVNGTGMGLYLARHIIEQHGGRIWLESEEGKGTTVSVALPKTAGEIAPQAPAQTKG